MIGLSRLCQKTGVCIKVTNTGLWIRPVLMNLRIKNMGVMEQTTTNVCNRKIVILMGLAGP
jgi:hypothetical protein